MIFMAEEDIGTVPCPTEGINTNLGPGKPVATPVMEAGRLSAYLTSPSTPPNSIPKSHSQVCSKPPAACSTSSLSPSSVDHTDLHLQTSFALFIALSLPQLLQASPRNPQATSAMKQVG